METESLKTQVKMLKWIFGGMMAAFLLVGVSLGTVIYAHGASLSDMKQTVAFQMKTAADNTSKIVKNSDKLDHFGGNLKENGVHLVHIKTSIKEIKEMMKEFYTRK